MMTAPSFIFPAVLYNNKTVARSYSTLKTWVSTFEDDFQHVCCFIAKTMTESPDKVLQWASAVKIRY